MAKHNLSTEKDPPYECDYCSIEFCDYVALLQHKKLHLNRPNNECVICGVVKKTLKKHMQGIHVSQKSGGGGNFVIFQIVNLKF